MIEQPVSFRLVYTCGLSGRIEMLSRLLTLVKIERASAPGIFALADLGLSCSAEAWICNATDGRGMLVAMDALGYDAFHIGKSDPLYARPDLVMQIKQVITTPLAAGPWSASLKRQDTVFTLANAAQLPANPQASDLTFALSLRTDAPTTISVIDAPNRVVAIQHGFDSAPVSPTIKRIDLMLYTDAPFVEVGDPVALEVTDDLYPDATISGVIEFVESEARQSERRRDKNS